MSKARRSFGRGNNNGGNNKNGMRRRNGNGGRQGGNTAQILQKAQQAKEKYLNLARESLAAGDRIEAEHYYQHVDHYVRVINAIEFERQQYAEQEAAANPAPASAPAEAAPETEAPASPKAAPPTDDQQSATS